MVVLTLLEDDDLESKGKSWKIDVSSLKLSTISE